MFDPEHVGSILEDVLPRNSLNDQHTRMCNVF